MCVDLSESGSAEFWILFTSGYIMWIYQSGFAALWIFFVSGYNLWIYQRLDLLFIGCSLHPEVEQLSWTDFLNMWQ